MAARNITLTAEAREVLRELRNEAARSDTKLPRLEEHEAVALTLDEPQAGDFIVEERGQSLLAVSQSVLDRIGERARLDITRSETGEPEFKIVQDAQTSAGAEK